MIELIISKGNISLTKIHMQEFPEGACSRSDSKSRQKDGQSLFYTKTIRAPRDELQAYLATVSSFSRSLFSSFAGFELCPLLRKTLSFTLCIE